MICPNEEKITSLTISAVSLRRCMAINLTATTMWTARWCSISSMFLSVRFSLRSATTFGIHLIFSMRRNSMKRQDCITMEQDTMTQGWACGLAAIQKKKTTLHSIVIVTRQIIPLGILTRMERNCFS